MPNLCEFVDTRISVAAACAVKDFFDAAGLPVPEEGEYFESADSGTLVFLQDEACVIRLASPWLSSAYSYLEPEVAAVLNKKSFKPVIDPDLLQPVGIKTLGDNFYLEIVPGIKNGAPLSAYEPMAARIKSRGHAMSDFKSTFTRNSGLLPDGTPLLLDRGSVSRLSGAASDVKILLSAQDRFFDDLHQSFDEAWPENSERADKGKMTQFWQKCRKMKHDEVLVAGWNDTSSSECYNIESIKKPAEKYQMRRNTLLAPIARRT